VPDAVVGAGAEVVAAAAEAAADAAAALAAGATADAAAALAAGATANAATVPLHGSARAPRAPGPGRALGHVREQVAAGRTSQARRPVQDDALHPWSRTELHGLARRVDPIDDENLNTTYPGQSLWLDNMGLFNSAADYNEILLQHHELTGATELQTCAQGITTQLQLLVGSGRCMEPNIRSGGCFAYLV
jgi:hypothetical protein